MKKEDKKALKNQYQQNEKEKINSSLPISLGKLEELFIYLDKVLSNTECDNTLKITSSFLESHNLVNEKVIKWMLDHGGYCDCEILMNIKDKLER